MRRSRLSQSVGQMVVRGLLLATVMVGVSVVACSSDSPDGIGNGHTVPTDGGTYACTDGVTRACFVTIGEHNGVLTCYEGTQQCVEGGWTECGDGTVTSKQWSGPYKPASGMRVMALTDAAACEDNPCDPTCQNFEGDPDVVPEPEVVENWTLEFVGGSVAGLPKGLVYGKGIVEPCEWGGDCQFNHECTNVVTDTACASYSHSKCKTGVAFGGACATADPCVAAICADDPTCCGGACVHDPCLPGKKLKESCDPCVTAICEAMPACCTTQWTSACVAAIPTYCGAEAGADALTCGCQAGDSAFGGACYRYVPDSGKAAWLNARTACRAIGAGWDLVAISSQAEDAHVGSLSGANAAWIGLSLTGATWGWSNGEAYTYNATHWADSTFSASNTCAAKTAASWGWNDGGCNTQRAYVCEGPGTASRQTQTVAPGWTQDCVNKVATVCDATCGNDTGGQCMPRGEGSEYIDDTCIVDASEGKSGIDLSVAVPCDNKIPICNYGTETAPSGIPIVHYPGNSTHYGTCYPPDDGKGVTCSTSEPIPPGKCIWVTTCGLGSASIGSNRQIYVNPSWLSGHQPGECSCLDNWSESHRGVPCLPPVCETATAAASLKNLNLFLMVDRSGSMLHYVANPSWPNNRSCCDGYLPDTSFSNPCDPARNTAAQGNRWTAARGALSAFFESPTAAGINVSLEFFPLNKDEASLGNTGCGTQDSCMWEYCKDPLVSLGGLTDADMSGDPHEAALYSWINSTALCPPWNQTTAANMGTPTYPALKGAIEAALAHRNALTEAERLDSVHAVVLVSDGEPTTCTTNSTLISGLASAALPLGVRTYTIGIGGSGLTLLSAVAAAGGTGAVIPISSTDPTTTKTELLNALLGIATNSAACEFTLPSVDLYDPTDVTVIYLPGDIKNDNKNDAIPYNRLCAGAGAACSCVNCDFCFDNALAPTKLTLCDGICNTITADPLAQVSVMLGCPTNYEPAEGSQVYQGTCPPGARVQWGYFAYDTTTPLDSYVEFSFRTAETEAALTGDFVVGPTAKADPNSQVCAMIPVTATCPVDLYKTLDVPAAMMPVIEVKATAYPSSSKHEFPTINDWQLTYSCPSSE